MGKSLSKEASWTLGLSTVAIFISFATPFVTYFWLDSQIQSFKNRGRIQISEPPPNLSDRSSLITGRDSKFIFNITNIGNLPAKSVELMFSFESANEGQAKVTFEPALFVEPVVRDKRMKIILGRAIPPQGNIKISVSKLPDKVWVFNEYGDVDSHEPDYFTSRNIYYRTLRILQSDEENLRTKEK